MVGLPDTDLDALYDFGCTILNRDYALNGILVANGRIGAMLDIPTYTPFCDRAVSNFILGLDAGLRCHPTCGESDGFVYKALHREVAKHLLESDIIDRPKQGGAISPAIHLQSTKKVTEIRTALVRSPFINETFHCPMVSSFFDAPKVNATRILILLTLDVWHYIFRECDYQSAPEFSLSDFLHLRGTV